MTKKHKKMLNRIIISAILLLFAICFERLVKIDNLFIIMAIYLVPYFIIGYDVLKRAFKNIINGQVFDENFLMTIATIGAVLIGFFPNTEPQYAEAVFVMLFYQIGELFQSIAVGKSRKSIASLMDIRPDIAMIERDGQLIKVDPESVNIGEIITVRAGEKIALDGNIVEGESTVDAAALTGEAIPLVKKKGDLVLSGCVNLSGVLKIKVTKPFSESTVSKILELVENSSEHKSKSENFITKFARYYTPIVVASAMILAFIPPLFSDLGYISALPSWIIKALTFLVISCPCALVISVPLSFFGGIGGASKKGILIKGSNYLETLANAETIVFDKTGTLTSGSFSVTEINSEQLDNDELLRLAAHCENYSNHPIALALKKAYGKTINTSIISDVKETAGYGTQALIGSEKVFCGNKKFMSMLNIPNLPTVNFGTVVYVAINNQYAGYIVISDQIKPNSKSAVACLKKQGIKHTVMLTGDRKSTADIVCKETNIDEYYSELLPNQKVEKLEQLLKETDKSLIFVGDGINDAPVLMRADIGIAMGALGSDAAIEAADIVLMDDDPLKIPTAIQLAKNTIKIVRQNIAFALGVKALVLVLSILGYTPMWAAVFADVGVAVIAILNAMRTLK